MANPHFILAAVVTIDGKIARYPGHFSNWTSAEDKNHLHALEDTCDVIILGRTTYELAAEPLAHRTCLVFTRSINGIHKKHERCIFINPETVSLAQVMIEYGWRTACVLGGTEVYSYFLKNNLIDELYLTIEPIIFGEGLSLFETTTPDTVFTCASVKQLNTKGTLLLHYTRASLK
ncbi:MAG TPA: hypothetical protein DDW36_01820 [Candidatus Magasanikbacteria bacterium]|nr:hypothetical protein [Candidatus Magasanikbacteria bacterium]